MLGVCKMSRDGMQLAEKYLLSPGDVLVNRTNSLELVGKAATFDRQDGEWAYASYVVRIQVDTERVLPEFVTATINSRIGRRYVLRTARRAIGMVNINAKEMAGFPIPLPPRMFNVSLLIGSPKYDALAS